MKRWLAAALAATALTAAAPDAEAQHLRVALREDPDILDPTMARTFVGRIVFSALCDKLFDIDQNLQITGQLVSAHRWESPTRLVMTIREGVRFHDGDPMTAEAVRYSLMRHLEMQGSFRRGEIAAMASVDVVDEKTVAVNLREPSAPFLSQLTDRAGMIVSPRAAEAAGAQFGTRPVCAGPFRFVERVAQDRIVVDRFDQYWDRGNVHLERVTYRPIPDNTVRLANLQSGAVEFAERMEPDDLPQIRRNSRLRAAEVPSLGYQGITFNVANGPRAQTPFGQDRRVREAFELSIDRAAINQVVYQGAHAVNVQAVPPSSPFHIREIQPEARNPARARQLLQEAGVALPVRIELTVANNPDQRQVAEVMQAMLRETGFDLRINAMEFASSLQAAQRGEFDTYLVGWSGRTDPDGNIWAFLHSRGAQNDGRYSNPEVDRLLDAARFEPDTAKRREIYAQVWNIVLRQDRGRMYLWSPVNVMAHSARLAGYVPVPDGLLRVKGLRLQ